MSDITYTAQGTFDRQGIVNINVCIPKQSDYNIEFYNFSKISANGSVNAIFCHFSTNSNVALIHDRFDFKVNFDIKKIKSHSGAVDFNEFSEDSLFLFFHNDEFNFNDRRGYFDRLEQIYEDVKQNGNQSQDGFDDVTGNSALSIPRKIGMSLVSRLAH